MGHVRKKHLLLFVLLFIIFILLAYRIERYFHFDRTFKQDHIQLVSAPPGDLAATLVSLFAALPVIVLMVIFFGSFSDIFSETASGRQTCYAMELIGDPQPLISSLEKIAFRSGRIEDMPSWHHFSIRQRIDFLVEAFKNRSLTRKTQPKALWLGTHFRCAHLRHSLP